MTASAETFAAATSNQRGLWLLDRLVPFTTTYNLARAASLIGPLDVPALRGALAALVLRHASLRTRVVDADDAPALMVAADPDFDLQVEDLSGLEPELQLARADELTRNEAQTPFVLSEGPLVRVRLLRLGLHEHRLLLTMHHIISDDWSLVVFWRELTALYDACRSGTLPQLDALPMQFAEYAGRQNERLLRGGLCEQLEYWRQALDGLPVLALPTDRPRPCMPNYRGRVTSLSLTPELTGRLRALSRTQGTTLFTTLLAALQVFLYRHCGQEDMAIGVPVRGRLKPEHLGLIGYCVNMLVIRADLSGAPSFVEHLARVRARTAAAYARQDVPFDELVKAISKKRDPSRNPLFQVSLTKWAPDSGVLQLGGLEPAEVSAVDTGSAMFDLAFTVLEKNGQCQFLIEYATDLFDASTIERWAGNFNVLLEGIVTHPDTAVGDLPFLTDHERHRLLVEWNDTAAAYPSDKTLAKLFEEQVRRTPDAVALMQDEQSLSYSQLNARANQLAHHLRALGARPEVPVAICMERSIHSVVGVLAVLKAGAAYLPIDPQYPQERADFMLADAGASIVLVHAATRDRFTRTGVNTVCVDADHSVISCCPDFDPSSLGAPEHLAYIIYTSGSTGTPKGVQILHRGIANHVAWISQRLQLGPTDRVLHFTSIGFDASVWEMLAPLCVGASLFVARPGGERDMSYIASALQAQRLTVMQAVPSVLRALLDEPPMQHCRGLRHIVCGGEALDHELVARIRRLAPWVCLGNFYGPTEVTIDATHFDLDGTRPGNGAVPIGRPIANTRCHVLDANLRLVPIGAIGELFVGGVGLARGYLNQDALTATRFISDPFRPGERLYRTGDMAYRKPDGTIVFAGRNDDQVKIRGFRIEPGEIAAVLATHPSVRGCHVAAARQTGGEVGLVAYLALDKGDRSRTTVPVLRRFLSSHLPGHMIPPAFVVLDSLPLTINGKVDTRALPDPATVGLAERVEYVAPVDDTERVMCRVWAEVLRVGRVGTEDNFFELGGHSLLAAKLFARLDEEFGHAPALGILFIAPTVRRLAEHYREAMPHADARSHVLVSLRAEGSRPPLYFVPGIFGNVVGYVDLVRELGPDQPIYGLQSVGLNGSAEPFDSIERMANHYLRELRVHQPSGPYAIIGVCFGATVAYEMTRQLLESKETVAFLGLLSPTTHEAAESGTRKLSAPRIVRRALAFGNLARERLRVYLRDMNGLSLRARLRYMVRKFHSLGGNVIQPRALKGAQRELNQIEVYRANLHALDTFVRKPLEGRLVRFEVFDALDAEPLENRPAVDWALFWDGPIERHLLPGNDSGDMLSGPNARAIAGLLAERMHTAFKSASR